MRRYDTYVLYEDTMTFALIMTEDKSPMDSYAFMAKEQNKNRIFCMDIVKVDTNPNKEKREPDKVTSHNLYLGGFFIKQFRKELTIDDVKKTRKKLAQLYKMDGTIIYYPNIPLSVQDIKDMLGLKEQEWYTLHMYKRHHTSKRTKNRYLIYYDWAQFNKTREKELNKAATEQFHEELFGDVLFINENLVS